MQVSSMSFTTIPVKQFSRIQYILYHYTSKAVRQYPVYPTPLYHYIISVHQYPLYPITPYQFISTPISSTPYTTIPVYQYTSTVHRYSSTLHLYTSIVNQYSSTAVLQYCSFHTPGCTLYSAVDTPVLMS